MSPCLANRYVSHVFHMFQASGQASQRVSLATRTFSNTVAQAMAAYLPQRVVQAEAVRTIDAWFDTMNSRQPFNAKPERCGYGVSAAAKECQDVALSGMDSLIREARKTTAKQPSGRSTLLPFQHGIIRGIASLRGLYSDLQTSCPEMRYLMTSHLNQDCVENAFSQLRSMCGSNTTPDAVEARVRIRIMLMAPSPLAAVQSRGRPVRLEEDTDFVTTCAEPLQPDGLTNAAFEGLDVVVS